jgi:hypothetical protein
VRIAKYRVDGLYIKLDKKLTLRANRVTIPKRKSTPTVAKVDRILKQVKYGLHFFKEIDLKKIRFDNNVLGIHYHKGVLQIDSKEYLIRGSVALEGKLIKATVPMLYLKKHQITMQGRFNYHINTKNLEVEGIYAFKQLAGRFMVHKKGDHLFFKLNSRPFEDLEALVRGMMLPKALREWAIERVRAKHYTIKSLSAMGEIVDGAFRLDTKSIKGEITFDEVAVNFKDNLAPIEAKRLDLSYDKEVLEFAFGHPNYLKRDLNGTRLFLSGLGSDKMQLDLHLKLKSAFDKELKALLRAYGVDIPLMQHSGTMRASIDIGIPLLKKGLALKSHIRLSKGELEVSGVRLPIVSGAISYEGNRVKLEGIKLRHENYFGTLDGDLLLKKKRLNATFDAHYIRVGGRDEPVVEVKNHKIPFVLEYAKGVHAQIPRWSIDFLYEKGSATLNLGDLKKIHRFIDQKIPIAQGGEAKLVTEDFNYYRFDATIGRSDCFLYEKSGACATKMKLSGKITPSNVDFYAFDKRLYFNQAKGRIKLDGLNIDLKRLIEKELKSQSPSPKANEGSEQAMVILGKNSHIRYEEYKLLTDSYDVEILKNGDIRAIASADGDIIKFSKKGEIMSLKALRIKDRVLHRLINFDGLKKGRYSLRKRGDLSGVTKGEIIVEGGVMQGFKAYNNTLAFINTLPAWAALKDPGYSDEGFVIKSGLVEYQMVRDEKIIFNSIYIEGESANIVGRGMIDLKAQTIHMQLNIQVGREIGKALGRIPFVGYILAGEDQSITMALKITGALDKPLVTTSAGKDLINYPMNVIKRTIEAPQKFLQE